MKEFIQKPLVLRVQSQHVRLASQHIAIKAFCNITCVDCLKTDWNLIFIKIQEALLLVKDFGFGVPAVRLFSHLENPEIGAKRFCRRNRLHKRQLIGMPIVKSVNDGFHLAVLTTAGYEEQWD